MAQNPSYVPILLLLLACAQAPPPRRAGTAERTPERAPAPAPTAFVSPYSYEWFIRAELLSARGQHAAAVDAYRKAEASADGDPYLYARMARALAQAGRFEEAEAALQRGLQLDPKAPAVWMARGTMAELQGDAAKALEAYERAESAAPEDPEPPRALARLLYAGGHDARALAVLTRYAARAEGGVRPALAARLQQALQRGGADELGEVAQLWVQHAPRERAVLQRAAYELHQRGQPFAALAVLERLPPADRGMLEAELLLVLGRFDELELRLLQQPPDRVGGALRMAELLLDAGRPARALELLSEMHPDDDPHRFAWLRGRALLSLGQPSEASLLLARVPRDSRYHAAAQKSLQHALERAGLPELAAELGSPP